uniref:Cadherin domain-containing protein n=1 Tax=Syphacia muris TaxID=451379 RepID=A0A0N5ATG2_9BILA
MSTLILVLCCFRDQKTVCDSTTVQLIVSDLNDNVPQFELNEYFVEIPLDLPLDSPVVAVRAFDLDSGDNGKITYSLKNGQESFNIDSGTGIIKLGSRLSKLVNYTLTVQATDSGYPPQRNTTQVFIRVGDSNPSSPVFDQLVYQVTRFTPVPAGSVLITLRATDPDPGRDGQITYRIVRVESANNKEDKNKFFINHSTGQLSTNVRLTDQDTSFTSIIVEAVDQSPEFSRKAEAVVQLTLISERKQKLLFYPLPKRIFLSSSLPPGTAVLK